MAPLLGKRKRRVQLEEASEENSAKGLDPQEDELSGLFKQYFEANFEPLPTLQLSGSANVTDALQDDTDDETDWEGLSNEDGDLAKVVDYSAPRHGESGLSRDEIKSFMVAPPLLYTKTYP